MKDLGIDPTANIMSQLGEFDFNAFLESGPIKKVLDYVSDMFGGSGKEAKEKLNT